MNRKTNIFYDVNSEDSNFLTFNNYCEALTGDILSLDYKLWPSRFICVYIENLDKEDFIKKLQQYYENKLAVLRDHIEENENIDDTFLLPLNYLITFLYWYSYNNGKEAESQLKPLQIESELLNNNTDVLNSVQFNYISDIVEQQYNGTYTDIICTINPNIWNKPTISCVNLDVDTNGDPDINSYVNENGCVVTVDNKDFLHGWENTDLNSRIYDYVINPIMDNEFTVDEENTSVYYIKSLINKLKINEVNNETNLKFNLVIPLFNLINTVNAEDIDDEDNTEIELNNKSNIPLGIYFTDTDIELNINGKFSTNWSLLISTQFSAFPFSFDIQQNFDDSQSNKQAYVTFAEILAKQTNFTDALIKYDNLVKSLQQKIELLESKLNNISSVQNIDSIVQNVANISKKVDDYITSTDSKLEELSNKIDDSKLKWKITQKNQQ